MEVAKRNGTALILVGHVTKEGAVAGPRVLEHLVDCVLALRGRARALLPDPARAQEPLRRDQRGRRLRDALRRPGRGRGSLRPLRRRGHRRAPGSVVLCAMEGTRPLLVEVQALVAPTEVVPPRRVANGIDRNRLAMILAVLARHGGVQVGGADVFVNVAGGVRVDEPGADLAIALAVASAQRGEPLADADGKPLACFGEVGLTGELRYVAPRRAPRRRGAQVRARPGARPARGESEPGAVDGAEPQAGPAMAATAAAPAPASVDELAA